FHFLRWVGHFFAAQRLANLALWRRALRLVPVAGVPQSPAAAPAGTAAGRAGVGRAAGGGYAVAWHRGAAGLAAVWAAAGASVG
nr:hypothetical protein [Tanacetum cinerariifolium]